MKPRTDAPDLSSFILHPSSFRLPPSSFITVAQRHLRTILVLVGLATALVSVVARRTNNTGLATSAAVLSLVIAGLIVIFIVPPLTRSARLEMGRLDLPFEVKLAAESFLILIGVVALLPGTRATICFSSSSPYWRRLSSSAGCPPARHFVTSQFSARFPDHIFAGEAAPVIVTLRNTKRLLPSFSTFVEARGPVDLSGKGQNKGQQRKRRGRFQKRTLAYFVYVPHAAAAEQSVEQMFPSGATYSLLVSIVDTLSFWVPAPPPPLASPQRGSDRLSKAASNRRRTSPAAMYAGRTASLRRGVGHDLFSLRDYQPQDDLRHIDWKATARVRRLTVREFTAEDERRITIILDPRVRSKAKQR